MFTFATKSYTLKNTQMKYTFLPSVGFVIRKSSFFAIASRSFGLNISTTGMRAYHGAIYGEYDSTSDTNKKVLNYGKDIILDAMDKDLVIVRNHNKFNVTKNKLNSIDRFLCSVTLLITPDWYHHFFKIKPGDIFQKLPFQQMMLIDKLVTMLTRSDIAEYADLVLMELKQPLGLSSLTLSQCYHLLNRFNKKAISYVIPRRHGKTKFNNCMMALCVVFFPCVNLEMAYVAQTKDLTKEAFETVKKMSLQLCEGFNRVQKQEYDKRLKQKTPCNIDDFYYDVESTCIEHSDTVVCVFRKHTNEVISHNTRPVSRNTLSCIVYREQNVSIIICIP